MSNGRSQTKAKPGKPTKLTKVKRGNTGRRKPSTVSVRASALASRTSTSSSGRQVTGGRPTTVKRIGLTNANPLRRAPRVRKNEK